MKNLARPPMLTAALLFAGAIAIGCGSDPAPPQLVPAAGPGNVANNAAPAAAAGPGADTATESSGSIHIDDEILRACGDLPKAQFAFDSSRIQDDAARVLDALAACFTKGALAGRSMKLVGHADPNGEVEYNLALGQRRSGGVADYLATKGMEKAKMEATSKGEFDATGVDEAGWARDRRVDVLLVK